MSQFGIKPTLRDVRVESAFRGKAEVKSAISNPQMIRSTTQPKRPIMVRVAGRAHGLQRGSNAARAVDRRNSAQSATEPSAEASVSAPIIPETLRESAMARTPSWRE
jgi:hypothetical protein